MKNFLFGSIVRMVTIHAIIAVTSFIVIISLVISVQIERSLITLRDRSLNDTAQDIASYLEKTDDGTVYLDMPTAERKFYADAGKFDQYLIRDEDGKTLFTSPIAFTELFPNEPWMEGQIFNFVGPSGTHFVGTSSSFYFDGKTYSVQVAKSENAAESFGKSIGREFVENTIVWGAPLVLLVAIVVIASVRHGLRPLLDLSRQARSVSFDRINQRFREDDVPGELVPLVQALNGAFERLAEGVAVQQQFSATVAHELRTPLTILRARAETLPSEDLVSTFVEDIDATIHTLNQLLDFSRLEFKGAYSMQPVDINDIAKSVCRDMWPLFRKFHRELGTAGLEGRNMVQGNADLIYRALRNLVENALKHTPPQTAVNVVAGKSRIMVCDAGKRFNEDRKNRILSALNTRDPGTRSIESGLGIPIVGRTMRLHGGRLTITAERDISPGNCFALEFPSFQQGNGSKAESQPRFGS